MNCEKCGNYINNTAGICYCNQFQTYWNFSILPEKGWECPRCNRCYSPSTFMCYFCSPIKIEKKND